MGRPRLGNLALWPWLPEPCSNLQAGLTSLAGTSFTKLFHTQLPTTASRHSSLGKALLSLFLFYGSRSQALN